MVVVVHAFNPGANLLGVVISYGSFYTTSMALDVCVRTSLLYVHKNGMPGSFNAALLHRKPGPSG